MRRFGLVVFSAVALALAGLPFAAPPAVAATQWANTATRAMSLRDATKLGAAAPSTPLRLAVALRLRHVDALKSSISAGRVMSSRQFVSTYAPTAAQVHAVQSVPHAQGLHGRRREQSLAADRNGNRRAGVVGVWHAHRPVRPARAHRVREHYAGARAGEPRFHRAVGGGLSNASRMTGNLRIAKNAPSSCAVAGVGYPCTYNPQGLWRAYDATKAPTGARPSIAVFAQGALGGSSRTCGPRRLRTVCRRCRSRSCAPGPRVPTRAASTSGRWTRSTRAGWRRR